MTLAERPTLADEAREAFLAQMRAESDDVRDRLGFDLEPDPEVSPMGDTLLGAMRREDWMRDALCQEPAYVDLPWIPGHGDDVRPLKEVCARCLVADECRQYAIDNAIDDGCWGGVVGQRGLRQLRRDAKAA